MKGLMFLLKLLQGRVDSHTAILEDAVCSAVELYNTESLLTLPSLILMDGT